jgi:hypothetical protein
MTFEELYEKTKPALDEASKQSFKEYKNSGAPRTFSAIFNELQENDNLYEFSEYNDKGEKSRILEDINDNELVDVVSKLKEGNFSKIEITKIR